VSLEEARKEVGADVKEKPVKLNKIRLLSVVFITAILIIAAIFAYPKIFQRDTLEKLRSSGERISVAVMPFQNLTNDTTKWDGYQEILQSILTSTLSNFPKEIQVRQSPLVNNLIDNYEGYTTYSSITPSFANRISRKLETDIFIYGNIIKAGNIIRLNTQIIDTRTEAIIKTFQIEGPPIEEELLHKVDSLSNLVSNFLILSKLGKELNFARQGNMMTESPEAFRCFIKGDNFYYKGQDSLAIPWFLKAIEIDSCFLRPKLLISWAYNHMGLYDEAKKWCRIVEKEKDALPENLKLWLNCLHAQLFETVTDEIYHLKQLLEIDDQQPEGYWALGIFYNLIGDYNRAIPELKKAFELYDKWNIKPLRVEDYSELGYAYLKTGQHRRAKKLFRKAEQDYPDNLNIIGSQAILSLATGKMKDASHYNDKFKTISQDQGWSEARIVRNLANIYDEANYLNDAEELYRKSLFLETKNSLLSVRLNVLAYFLIKTDRNINEGLELVDKALEISPDNYEFLDTKGWGLYKQGKYQEALDLFQKSDSLKPVYNHQLFLHLEAARKAVTGQENN
jgi:tetratricopeptide (TPR) repeat protein